MLYLWAYITFFSIPLTYPFVLQGLIALLAILPLITALEPTIVFSRHKILPRLKVGIIFIIMAILIVRFNTIIHPFTLADNRHYPFYVFRYLFRHPAVRFLVTPAYISVSWSVIQALGSPAKLMFPAEPGETYYVQSGKRKALENKEAPGSERPIKLNRSAEGQGCDVSYVLIWLGTSALQLVTAPLVEPRYFIIPWIMWRLRVPETCSRADPDQFKASDSSVKKWLKLVLYEHDHRLWLETAWFLGINAVTCWIFLNWEFEWENEPGQTQRFMW